MNILKNGLIAAVIAAVVAFGVGALHGGPTLPAGILTDAGETSGQSFGATAAGLSTVVFSHLTNLQVNQNLGVISTFFQGASAALGNPLQVNATVPTAGSTNCNTSTSTLFAVQPPSGATSTVSFAILQGSVAQTSDILIGTSTTPGGMTSTSTLNVTGNGGLVGAAAVATGQFYIVPGIKVPNAKGGTVTGNGGYNSQFEITVGPSEYLVGYASSTAVTGGNGASSCSYKIEWYN